MYKTKIKFLLVFFLFCSLAPEMDLKNQDITHRSKSQIREDFINPPLRLKSRPLWFWNKPLSKEQTLKVMKASKDAGYYGLGILPSGGMTPEFMTPQYLAQYKAAVE